MKEEIENRQFYYFGAKIQILEKSSLVKND